MAEVVSRDSVTRDYQIKGEEYLAFGLLENWIVDPFKSSSMAFRSARSLLLTFSRE